MKDRRIIQRALLRRTLRKEMRHSEPAESSLIQLALDDDAIFETLYEQAMQNVKQYGNSTGLIVVTAAEDGSPIVDNLLRLLQWFVDNGPMLIEIIRLIVEMFGGLSAAVETCEAETMFVE